MSTEPHQHTSHTHHALLWRSCVSRRRRLGMHACGSVCERPPIITRRPVLSRPGMMADGMVIKMGYILALQVKLSPCPPKFLPALPLPPPSKTSPPPPLRTRKAKPAHRANSPSLNARAAKRLRSWVLSRLPVLLGSLSGGKRATRFACAASVFLVLAHLSLKHRKIHV